MILIIGLKVDFVCRVKGVLIYVCVYVLFGSEGEGVNIFSLKGKG